MMMAVCAGRIAGLPQSIDVGPEEPFNAAPFDELVLGTATEILPTLLHT
jgi:hypothetical protein